MYNTHRCHVGGIQKCNVVNLSLASKLLYGKLLAVEIVKIHDIVVRIFRCPHFNALLTMYTYNMAVWFYHAQFRGVTAPHADRLLCLYRIERLLLMFAFLEFFQHNLLLVSHACFMLIAHGSVNYLINVTLVVLQDNSFCTFCFFKKVTFNTRLTLPNRYNS